MNYFKTFFSMEKLNLVRVILSLSCCKSRLAFISDDVKNAFFTEIYNEYMELQPKLSLKDQAILKTGYKKCHADNTSFVKRNGLMVTILIVYVDDIVATGNNMTNVKRLKKSIRNQFEIKDLGKLIYILSWD